MDIFSTNADKNVTANNIKWKTALPTTGFGCRANK